MTFTLPHDFDPTRRDMIKRSLNAIIFYSFPGIFGCKPKRPFRIAIHPWAGYQFIFFAREEGLLPEKEIVLVKTAILSESSQALFEGRVDAATITLDEVLRLMDLGVDVKVVLIFDVSAGADALLAVPEILTPSELKGQRIGVENGTLGIVMLNKSLEAADLHRSDVIVVPLEENHFNAWNRSNPLDTSYRLASLLGTPPDSVSQIFRGLNLPDLHYNRKYLSAPVNDLTRSALELGDIMQREGMIEFLPNLDRMFVSDYLPRKNS